MNKYLLFVLGIALNLSSLINANGQIPAPDNMYPKYNSYYNELAKWLEPWKAEHTSKTLKEIISSAAKLTDDTTTAGYVRTIRAGTKALSDESIYTKRKQGVLVVGKLTKSVNGLKDVNFDLIGTAFGISEDGTCVTNYHVLKNIIRPNTADAKRDSIYFIITAEKKVYLIDQVLAFSQNNDLAVFKANLLGNKLNAIPIGKPANVGAPVYCIAHPYFHFYTFTKGIVSRNVEINPADIDIQYNNKGKPPIRMEITADYAVGASGGPILDKYGNLTGVVISTTPLSYNGKDAKGNDVSYVQMMVKNTAPVKALTNLLKKQTD